MYVCMSVCPYVCPEAPGHSFWAKDLKFGTQHPCRLGKKLLFCFFELLVVTVLSVSHLVAFIRVCMYVCPYVCMYVCPYVCPEAPGHSFWAKDLKFGTQHPSSLRKKWLFYFFEFRIFKGLFTPFYPQKRWKMAKKALKTTKRGILSSAQFSR